MKVLMPLADGFEDIEAVAVIDILRRAGVQIDTFGIPGSTITSSRGIRISVDRRMVELKPDEYDGIIVVGGMKNVDTLGRTASVTDAIKKLYVKGKLVAAICAGPLVLAKMGILDDRKATIYPGLERELPKPRGEKIVVDGNVVTSQGPGTAVEFALKIVGILKGNGKADQIRQEIVA